MSSALCFILDQSKILSSGNGLKYITDKIRNIHEMYHINFVSLSKTQCKASSICSRCKREGRYPLNHRKILYLGRALNFVFFSYISINIQNKSITKNITAKMKFIHNMNHTIPTFNNPEKEYI